MKKEEKMKLTTKRLILRNLKDKDLNDLVRNANNLNVSRYLSLVPYPYTKKDGKWFIEHCKKEARKRPRKNYELGIELKEEGILIGVIGLTGIDLFVKKVTLGYWLGENYWRKGIMSEAVRKVIDFAFNKLKLNRVEVGHYKENKGSKSIIVKMGFKKEGVFRKDARAKSTGKFHDSHFYGLLKTEWKKS